MIHINPTSILSTNIHPFHPPAPGERLHLRGATSNGSGGSPEATSDRPTLPWNLVGSCGESQPLARLQALIPGEMTMKWRWLPPKKRKSPLPVLIEHEKAGHTTSKKMHSLIHCIHHHSSIIEATLNHSTVVASIHLTSSIPEMPAAHQETWCKSQPVKYHPKVETFEDFPFFPILSLCWFGGVCFFQGHDDSRGTQQKWPPPWARIIAILLEWNFSRISWEITCKNCLEWHRKYNSNCSALLDFTQWFWTPDFDNHSSNFKDSFDSFKVLLFETSRALVSEWSKKSIQIERVKNVFSQWKNSDPS